MWARLRKETKLVDLPAARVLPNARIFVLLGCGEIRCGDAGGRDAARAGRGEPSRALGRRCRRGARLELASCVVGARLGLPSDAARAGRGGSSRALGRRCRSGARFELNSATQLAYDAVIPSNGFRVERKGRG